MNFGFRLPGPFRVGISDKGRVNLGATVGPFSVSGAVGGGGGQGLLLPVTLDQFVRQAQAEGYSVQVTPGTGATIERRWQAAQATVVPGRGVAVKRVWSTWQILAAIFVPLLLVTACCLPGLLDS